MDCHINRLIRAFGFTNLRVLTDHRPLPPCLLLTAHCLLLTAYY